MRASLALAALDFIHGCETSEAIEPLPHPHVHLGQNVLAHKGNLIARGAVGDRVEDEEHQDQGPQSHEAVQDSVVRFFPAMQVPVRPSGDVAANPLQHEARIAPPEHEDGVLHIGIGSLLMRSDHDAEPVHETNHNGPRGEEGAVRQPDPGVTFVEKDGGNSVPNRSQLQAVHAHNQMDMVWDRLPLSFELTS